MKINEIQEFITAHSELGLDLEKAAREIPKLHGRAINIRANEIAVLKALEIERDQAKRDRWLFYSGKADASAYKDVDFNLKVLKGDIDIFLDSDKKMAELRSKIESQNVKIGLLDEFIKQINGRSFLISNILNWTKIQNGLV